MARRMPALGVMTNPKNPSLQTAPPERPRVEAWSFTNEELAEARAGLRMLSPSLDLSNSCNLNCSYCFVEDLASTVKKRRPGELTLAESLAIVDDFALARSRTVNLVGAGEPSIDPHFIEILERIHALGMRTMLFTNGVAIARSPRLAPVLRRLGVSVCLKLNSRDAALQDRLVGRPGYSAQRDLALTVLLEAGFACGSPSRLAVDILVMQAVLSEVPSLYEWCLRENIFPLIAEYIPTGRTIDGRLPLSSLSDATKMERPTPQERVDLARHLEQIDRRFGVPPAHGECAYFAGTPCTQLLGVYVDIQGTVWPCVARTQRRSLEGPMLREPLGSLRSGGAKPSALWFNSPYMKELRLRYTGACPYKLPVPSTGTVLRSAVPTEAHARPLHRAAEAVT